jgi:2-iminobutanoate/2-iminopropanoate deaminase
MKRRHIVIEGMGNPQWYAGAAVHDGLIWTAGQVPTAADGTMPEDFSAQVEVVIDNLERTLAACGGDLGTLIKVNTYLTSLDDFEAYNEVYVRRIGPHGLPPRTTVEVVRFPPPMRVELEAVAHVRDEEDA